jgi:hypothetical protein
VFEGYPESFANQMKWRLETLLKAIQDEIPHYKDMGQMMRALSDAATVGYFADSARVKKYNTLMSEAALELKSRVSYEQWHKLTTNEHPFPIKQIWLKWEGERDTLTIETMWNDIKDNPMVTILKSEDATLREQRDVDFTCPAERYRIAGIKKVETNPKNTLTFD